MKLILLVIALLACANAKSVGRESKIVGGQTATRSYPFQISLQVKQAVLNLYPPSVTYKYSHNCGGSIIKPNYVLTAAHCVVNYKPGSLSILAGTNQLNKGGKRYEVSKITVHPDYEELVTSDIAILKISGKFEYSSTIAPIKYPSTEVGGGVICTLTGWGYRNENRSGEIPNDLQYIDLESIDNEQCRKDGMNEVGSTEICTSAPKGEGACGGDSGGPLTTGDGEALAGVVSYGTSTCALGYPDVFTRVSAFVDWIDENTSD